MIKVKKKETHTNHVERMGRIKTSITIDKKLWNEFCVKIVREKGNRKISSVLEQLIHDYIQED